MPVASVHLPSCTHSTSQLTWRPISATASCSPTNSLPVWACCSPLPASTRAAPRKHRAHRVQPTTCY